MMLCASCGTAGGDDIKLKRCNGCFVVRYCGVKCQRDHWPLHKKECKKRAAELHDEILFKQPESSYLGDCPICYLPLPIDMKKSNMMSCCGKVICKGCDYANKIQEMKGKLQCKCAFCRQPLSKDEELIERLMKRMEANDPNSMCHMGTKKYIEGDYAKSFEYFSRAAALGNAVAHHRLSVLYNNGQGVERNLKKKLHHLKEAAIGGHPDARHDLGKLGLKNGSVDRAVKHFIIAAKLGYDKSLESVKGLHEGGFVSKEDFAAALCGYQAAIAAEKSPQRDEAAKIERWQAERERKGESTF